MANWVICTRKVDQAPIYINLDAVMWLRWNEDEELTVLTWSSKNGEIVRVLEKPEEIFAKAEQIRQPTTGDNAAASTQRSTRGRRQSSS
jgi:hypothetical protein